METHEGLLIPYHTTWVYWRRGNYWGLVASSTVGELATLGSIPPFYKNVLRGRLSLYDGSLDDPHNVDEQFLISVVLQVLSRIAYLHHDIKP